MRSDIIYKHIRYIIGDKYYSLKYKQEYTISNNKLLKLKNRFIDKDCVIIGTGNSLNYTNMSILKDKYVFGVNTLFNGFDKYGIKPDFYVVGDTNVYNNHKNKLKALRSMLFIVGYAGRNYLKEKNNDDLTNNIITMKPLFDSYKFSENIADGIYHGGTVIYLCLQIAYYMGFKNVHLIGCDSDYTIKQHFDDSKIDSLSGIAIGDCDKSFKFYKLAKKVFEDDGKRIINSTVGGKLEVFDRR